MKKYENKMTGANRAWREDTNLELIHAYMDAGNATLALAEMTADPDAKVERLGNANEYYWQAVKLLDKEEETLEVRRNMRSAGTGLGETRLDLSELTKGTELEFDCLRDACTFYMVALNLSRSIYKEIGGTKEARHLAQDCSRLGVADMRLSLLCEDSDEREQLRFEAENCFCQAVELWEEIAKVTGSRYDSEGLAADLHNLGLCAGERSLLEWSCQIWESLAEQNPGLPHLAEHLRHEKQTLDRFDD